MKNIITLSIAFASFIFVATSINAAVIQKGHQSKKAQKTSAPAKSSSAKSSTKKGKTEPAAKGNLAVSDPGVSNK